MKFQFNNSQKTIIFIVLFFGIFGLAKVSLAATYYVRIDGNNNCNGMADIGGSSGSCAFRTVQKGVDTATTPGDVVNIRGDHANEGLILTKANGCIGTGCVTNPSYITIQIAPGAAQYSAVISPGIQINHSYIIVHGLGITGSYGYSSGFAGVTFGWSGPVEYSRVTNNHFYNPRETVGSAAIVFGLSAHYNVVEGNLIEGDTNPMQVSGHHTGGSGITLTDSYYSWTPNQWQGRRVWNFTSGGWAGTDAGTVVSNDAHSIITTSNMTWNANDCYAVGSSYWIPIVISGTDNIFRNNIIRNLINSERVFDGMANNTIISGNEVANLIDGNDFPGGSRPVIDNCGAHTDIFQVWNSESNNITIENNYFHDLQSQTGMLEGNGHSITNWTMRNNIFANIAHRNTFMGPGFKWWNNTLFNVAVSDQVNPLEGWAPGGEYKNNIIIGGSMNPNFGIIGSGPLGDWKECAKNVITKIWQANTSISNWVGQGGTQAILTANGSVYIGSGSGNTGSSQPNWSANCPSVGNTCVDSGIIWTNMAWNTTCSVSGIKDVIFGDQWGWNKKTNVASSFSCNPSAVPGGDPRIYDAEGIKVCKIKDSLDNPASNNYYGIWNPPTYSARTASLISGTGDYNYINGGNPKFVGAFTDCVNNSCDFRLQSGSPLIGAGVVLSGVTTDKNGVTRPNFPTIGAYEYVSGGGDITPPAAPTGLSVA